MITVGQQLLLPETIELDSESGKIPHDSVVSVLCGYLRCLLSIKVYIHNKDWERIFCL